jgi:hypothetical protein
VSAVLSQKIAEDGFAILPDIFSSADIDNLIHGLVEFPLTRSRAGIRHAMHHPDVSEFAHDPLLCDMASSIFNQKAVPYRATLFDKSPDSNWLVVWHQDTALPRRERKEQTGWGPWSVKEGISYAHAPASALSEILALRLISMTHMRRTDRSELSRELTSTEFSATTRSMHSPST